MTPIERVRIKSKALNILNLPGLSGPEALKRAYKRRVLEVHPDAERGSHEAFVALKNAYEFLLEEVQKAEERVTPRKSETSRRSASRPESRPIETVFDVRSVAACCELQDKDSYQCSARHVAVKLMRHGRNLTYFVPTALRNGLNKVAMPAAGLGQDGETGPVLVTIRSSGAGESMARLPDKLAARLFPGAREVKVCFGG